MATVAGQATEPAEADGSESPPLGTGKRALPGTRGAAEAADPIDVRVGEKIREARMRANLSQEQLARRIGCSFQQLQKYEAAGNRVAASRLKRIADATGVPVSFFFEGDAEAAISYAALSLEMMETAEALAAVRSPAIRRRLKLFVEAVAEDLAHEEERIRAEITAELRDGRPKH